MWIIGKEAIEVKLVVLGANGRTGRYVVRRAVANGHEVCSFVYGQASSDPFLNGSVQCIGDAMNPNDIAEACKGADAVISALGHSRRSAADMQTRAMASVLRAARVQHLKIVSMTGSGVRIPGDKVTVIDRVLNWFVAHVDSVRVNDGRAHYELLRDSDVTWSMLRVLKLTNRRRGGYALSEHGPVKTFISREQAAEALVKLAESSDWDGKAPLVTS